MAQDFIEQTPSAQPQFAVRGDKQDDIRRQEAADPSSVEEVTEDEQAQYDDFISRAIAMISDARVPEGDVAESPSDAVIKVMSNSSFSIPQALSEGAVSTIMILHDAAKRAGKEYSPDVLFHGSDEVIGALYMLGAAAGIFDGASDYARTGGGLRPEAPASGAIPAPGGAIAGGASAEAQPPMAQAGGAAALQPQQPTAQAQGDFVSSGAAPAEDFATAGQEAPEESAEGDFTDDEYALMAEAKLLATEAFGKRLLESGQITEKEQREAKQYWDSQIQKEVESGEVDDAMFDNVDVNAIRAQMVQQQRGA